MKGVFLKGVGLSRAVEPNSRFWRCSRPSLFWRGHAQAEPEGGVNVCGNGFGVILRKEFIQALREPRMRLLLFLPPHDAAHRFRLRREPGRGPRAHRLDGHGPHAARAAICARASKARAASTWWRSRATSRRCRTCWTAAERAGGGARAAGIRARPGAAADTAEVQVLLDGTNSNTASLVSSYAGQRDGGLFELRDAAQQQNSAHR